MIDTYRVVCSENDRLYPGEIFVDIYPAGNSRPENCLTHNGLLAMRRISNPGVSNIEPGILLFDNGQEQPSLKYEKATSYSRRRYQESVHQKIDKKIYETFQKMKAARKNRTLEVSFASMAVLYDLNAAQDNDSPKSAREYSLIEENKYQKRLAQKRQELIEYKRLELAKYIERKGSSYTPEQMIAWKQARNHGD